MTRRTLIAAVVSVICALGLFGCGGESVNGKGAVRTDHPVQMSPSPEPRTPSNDDPYTKPEIEQAKLIPGLIYHPEPDHTHRGSAVRYDMTPPIGGDHSPIWADCAGTVYPNAIANENAVHMLEHGAVWITYQPGLPADQVATLSRLVDGVDRMALSPYPALKTRVSLQSWGYQLFVDDAADPRVADFVAALRFNPNAAPETAGGVTCADPPFKQHPSTFNHPIFTF